jgi:uncharacterized protein YndB with AHSA1/START domain
MKLGLESDDASDTTPTGYRRRLTIQATRQRVFKAIATVDGPRHWWTTTVTGSATIGGLLTFGFAGVDEQIIMHVDTVQRPSLVCWSCTAHTRNNEWTGSTLRFELAERGRQACELDFRHIGLAPELVAEGWDHFLASLAAYAELGSGSPFGT